MGRFVGVDPMTTRTSSARMGMRSAPWPEGRGLVPVRLEHGRTVMGHTRLPRVVRLLIRPAAPVGRCRQQQADKSCPRHRASQVEGHICCRISSRPSPNHASNPHSQVRRRCGECGLVRSVAAYGMTVRMTVRLPSGSVMMDLAELGPSDPGADRRGRRPPPGHPGAGASLATRPRDPRLRHTTARPSQDQPRDQSLPDPLGRPPALPAPRDPTST